MGGGFLNSSEGSIAKRPGSDDKSTPNGKGKHQQDGATGSSHRKKKSRQRPGSKKSSGASGGGDKPPHRGAGFKPLPQDAVDKTTLLEAFIKFLIGELTGTPVNNIKGLTKRLETLLANITRGCDHPEAWQKHFYSSLAAAHPAPDSLPVFTGELNSVIRCWATYLIDNPCLSLYLNRFIQHLFEDLDSLYLSSLVPDEVLTAASQSYQLSHQKPPKRRSRPRQQQYQSSQTDSEKTRRVYQQLRPRAYSLSSLILNPQIRKPVTQEEARLHLLSTLRKFLPGAQHYTREQLESLLNEMDLQGHEKEKLLKLLQSKSRAFAIGALVSTDVALFNALINFMERKSRNNHRRSGLVDLILQSVWHPLRAKEIAMNLQAHMPEKK